MKMASLLIVLLVCSGQMSTQQKPSACTPQIKYEDHNQLPPDILSVSIVSGRTIDPGGANVPNVCLGLFTEDDHHLVAEAVSDKDGKFNFKDVPEGCYRLVAQYSVFCTANVPIQVIKRVQKKDKQRQIVLHMDIGTDTCSYGTYNKEGR